MRSLPLVLCAALTACATSTTSPGELTRVENTGGFCNQSQPWCGWTADYAGAEVTMTSRTASAGALGTLTAAGQDELDELIAAFPIDTPSDTSQTCTDAAIVTLDITFDTGGPHTYSYSCDLSNFTDLASFTGDVAAALIASESDDRVTVTVP